MDFEEIGLRRLVAPGLSPLSRSFVYLAAFCYPLLRLCLCSPGEVLTGANLRAGNLLHFDVRSNLFRIVHDDLDGRLFVVDCADHAGWPEPELVLSWLLVLFVVLGDIVRLHCGRLGSFEVGAVLCQDTDWGDEVPIFLGVIWTEHGFLQYDVLLD